MHARAIAVGNGVGYGLIQHATDLVPARTVGDQDSGAIAKCGSRNPAGARSDSISSNLIARRRTTADGDCTAVGHCGDDVVEDADAGTVGGEDAIAG